MPPAQRFVPDMGKVVQDGFRPTLLEAAGTRDFSEGRSPVFTTRLGPGMEPHGRKSASAEAVQRCKADGKRCPYYWYEDRLLFWSGRDGGSGEDRARCQPVGRPQRFQVVGIPPLLPKSRVAISTRVNTSDSSPAGHWNLAILMQQLSMFVFVKFCHHVLGLRATTCSSAAKLAEVANPACALAATLAV